MAATSFDEAVPNEGMAQREIADVLGRKFLQSVRRAQSGLYWPCQPDLGFVALEAMLVAPADKRPAVARYASPAIIGTLATSAAMNVFAFASHAQGLMIYPAIGLGFAGPGPCVRANQDGRDDLLGEIGDGGDDGHGSKGHLEK
jgi:hypothetical protein